MSSIRILCRLAGPGADPPLPRCRCHGHVPLLHLTVVVLELALIHRPCPLSLQHRLVPVVLGLLDEVVDLGALEQLASLFHLALAQSIAGLGRLSQEHLLLRLETLRRRHHIVDTVSVGRLPVPDACN